MSKWFIGVVLTALLLFSTGCDDERQGQPCATSDECPAGQHCLDGFCAPDGTDGDADSDSDGDGDGDGDADSDADSEHPECIDHVDCDSGFCVSGSCCTSFEQVCGDLCCATDETCFANACVRPGRICHGEADCDEGQYCELGLGEETPPGDGGPGDGGVCLFESPPSGRCVDLPPPCPEGVLPDDGPICLPECEYHPTAGVLDAELRWRWGLDATEYPDIVDVWATPTVGRLYDTNCDGSIDELDPPTVIFVSGNAETSQCAAVRPEGDELPSACHRGVLRVIDGLTGQEIWSLRNAQEGSIGFSALSVAIGDLDGDERMDIATVTGEGHLVTIDALGTVMDIADEPFPGSDDRTFGWGGGLAIADMDGDGSPEIALGATVYTTAGGGLALLFNGDAGTGGRGVSTQLSTFADLDGVTDGHLELLAGITAYRADGTHLWHRNDLHTGFPGVGDFNGDGLPEAVYVDGWRVDNPDGTRNDYCEIYIFDGATGQTLVGPTRLPGDGQGGPPTVADFDGDGFPEIGVAQKDYYCMLKPGFTTEGGETLWEDLEIVWSAPNHDLSSSVTGSTVFDFEGDGAAEVIYNDECFLWVYDGPTGDVRFATPTTSFTGTEASLVADVDGDGHAEILMIANGANPAERPTGWGCDVAPWNQPDLDMNRPAWVPPEGAAAYRGLALFGDRASSWVGTRTLWNQHTYHVSNICDHRDSACEAPNLYGSIPQHERPNWTVSWLNNFRQNVQDQGLFNAPDATVSLTAECTEPLELHAFVRNLGAAILPAGVEVGFYVERGGGPELLGTLTTETSLFVGQVAELVYVVTADDGVTYDDTFIARIHIDAADPLFHECHEDNNESDPAEAVCIL